MVNKLFHSIAFPNLCKKDKNTFEEIAIDKITFKVDVPATEDGDRNLFEEILYYLDEIEKQLTIFGVEDKDVEKNEYYLKNHFTRIGFFNERIVDLAIKEVYGLKDDTEENKQKLVKFRADFLKKICVDEFVETYKGWGDEKRDRDGERIQKLKEKDYEIAK